MVSSCKVAAPIYGNLSKEHTNVLFLKVNVDEARDVARSCDISAMPTFKSYAEGKGLAVARAGTKRKY